MNLKDFTSALSASLVERGIPVETAKKHIARLIPTLSEEDLREIASFTSKEDFTDISDATAAMLSKPLPKVEKPTDTEAKKEEVSMPVLTKVHSEGKEEKSYPETPEGQKRFATVTACASPLFALGFILYFALWGLGFALEIAVIAFSIASLIAIAAIGAGSAVGGVIYGIVTMGSVKSAGLYEIGFGIVIAGVTFLACILIYNFALRFMPFAVKKTAELFRFCLDKVRDLLKEYRRRCFTK